MAWKQKPEVHTKATRVQWWNPSHLEAEAGRPQVQSQPWQHSETQSQKTKQNKHKNSTKPQENELKDGTPFQDQYQQISGSWYWEDWWPVRAPKRVNNSQEDVSSLWSYLSESNPNESSDSRMGKRVKANKKVPYTFLSTVNMLSASTFKASMALVQALAQSAEAESQAMQGAQGSI